MRSRYMFKTLQETSSLLCCNHPSGVPTQKGPKGVVDPEPTAGKVPNGIPASCVA